MANYQDILDALFELTQIEAQRELTSHEKALYVRYWEVLTFNGIDIPFAVEI